ncbi:hypothetical protein HPB51_027106 [Rhipicephalus microplus]|uniref:Tick transposon n=1 Tax=Rhipicephalus microplus TaxID=6941 RepID=A0A9J6D140_RHIMP|nr:hypothetical protein HPB51_027106 [Rhipicephalus microplus]
MRICNPRASDDKVASRLLSCADDSAPVQAVPPGRHKKALLLNALGIAGLNTYLHATEDEQQPKANRPTQETTLDVFDAALALLNELFDPQPDVARLRTYFKALRQGPDLSVVEFIQEVRRVAKLRQALRIGRGGRYPRLRPDCPWHRVATPPKNFFKMSKDFTVEKALDVVREEECVDRALLQLYWSIRTNVYAPSKENEKPRALIAREPGPSLPDLSYGHFSLRHRCDFSGSINVITFGGGC